MAKLTKWLNKKVNCNRRKKIKRYNVRHAVPKSAAYRAFQVKPNQTKLTFVMYLNT